MKTVLCPECGLSLSVPRSDIGTRGRCRGCHAVFVLADRVPAGSPATSPEAPSASRDPWEALEEMNHAIQASRSGSSPARNAADTDALRPTQGRRRAKSIAPIVTLALAILFAGFAAAVCMHHGQNLPAVLAASWPALTSQVAPPNRTSAVVVHGMPRQSIPELRPYRVSIGSFSPSEHELQIVNGPAGATVNESGQFLWTPTEEQGPGEYKIAIATKSRRTGEVLSRINLPLGVEEVSQPPVFDPIEPLDAIVGKPLRYQIQARDADLPAAPIRYALKGEKTSRTPEFDSETGELTWTPQEQDAGKKLIVVVQAIKTPSDAGVHPRTLTTDYPLYIQVRPLDYKVQGVVAQFRDRGARIESLAGFAEFDLKGEVFPMRVDGEELYVFMYDSAAAAEQEMNALQQTPARLTQAAERAGSKVRFYRQGDSIAAYAGKSAALLDLLNGLYGHPFAEAGRSSR